MDEYIKALASTIEIRDIYTAGHSERVATYAKEFAEKLGLDKQTVDNLEKAGILHDLGKIGIPDFVLLKPGKLDEEEFKIIKEHSNLSAYIVKKIPEYSYLSDIVKYHHENYDGTGYPEGLKGEEIPLESRILALADVFDALTTRRIYRKAFTVEETINIMNKMKSKFDPKLFPYFIDFVKERGVIEYKFDFLDAAVLAQLKNNIFFNDPLTKLLNRFGLLAILQQSCDYNLAVSLIEINIRGFKNYNFVYGASKGDELLKNLSKALLDYFGALNHIEEPKENKFFAGRLRDDVFILLYIGHKDKYLEYKLKSFQEKIKKEFGVDIYYDFILRSYQLSPAKFKEIGYLI